MTRTLDELRALIDEIDQQLVELISRRGEAAVEIGQAKAELKRDILDSRREDAVLSHVENANPGPLSDDDLRRIFEALVAACTAVQERGADGAEGQ